MAKFCMNCGSPLNSTAVFCGGCGAKIPVVAAAPAEPSAPPSPDPAAWGSLPATDVPPPVNAEAPWTTAPPPDTPPPITPDPTTWAQVPQAYTPPPAAAQPPAAFVPVPPAAYTPPPAAFAPVSPAAYTPPPATYAPAPAAYTAAAAYPAKKSNTLLKVIIAVVVLICVGSALALAGLYYAAKKITQKAHQVAAQARAEGGSAAAGGLAGLLNGASGDNAGPGSFTGDPCRFLSKAMVTQAVGLPVIRTDAKDGGCSYIAKGDPADVTAKHAAMMLGDMGADAQTQKTIQKFAGAIFAQSQASDKNLSAEAATGEIPVLVISFSTGNAQTEMKMNRGAFDRLRTGPAAGATGAAHQATGDLTGIGDESYVVGGSMMMVRKGNTVARFMYVSCPCNTENIKPLASLVARQL